MIERDFRAEPLEVLSFGAGTQSTTMLILAAKGSIPKPDLVVFADTGSETEQTYRHVEEWAKPFCIQHDIPFEVVTSYHGKLHEYYRQQENIPMIGFAKCTADFKIRPIRRRMREIVGKGNGKVLVKIWIGITVDEHRRRHPSDVQWVQNCYPLLDVHPMTRLDCISYLAQNGVDVGKSGCWLCPYAGKKHFKKLKAEHPDLFRYAMEMEDATEARLEKKGRKLHVGFMGANVRLRDLAQMPSLWDFEETGQNCETAQCFI